MTTIMDGIRSLRITSSGNRKLVIVCQIASVEAYGNAECTIRMCGGWTVHCDQSYDEVLKALADPSYNLVDLSKES